SPRRRRRPTTTIRGAGVATRADHAPRAAGPTRPTTSGLIVGATVSAWIAVRTRASPEPPAHHNASLRSRLRLPQRDLGTGGRRDDAAPASRALAGLQQHRGAKEGCALRRLVEIGDLDVGQPQGGLVVRLDDAALDPVAQLQREVGPAAQVDRLRAPAEE